MILGKGLPRYGACFEELDDAITALTDRTVVLNAHNFDPPPGSIVYNLENFDRLRHPTRWAAHEVWDFSARNVGRYPGAMTVRHVPVGYHPSMKRFQMLPWEERDIDVIFFGAHHPRRQKIFNAIRAHKLRVLSNVVAHGAERDALLARAKLAINLQYYENGVYPGLRTMHCVANGLPVVSETAPEMPGWATLLPHTRYEKLAELAIVLARRKEPLDVAPALRALKLTPLILPEPKANVATARLAAAVVQASPQPGPLVLSANYRGFDSQKPMPPNGFRYDEKSHDNAHLTGHYLGKIPKCAPHLLGHDEDDVLWIDASMRPTGKSLGSLFDLVPPGGVGCFRHRKRDCIYQELVASERMTRSLGEPLRKQTDHYRAMGHPPNWGLWECGIIVWRGAQKRIGEAWLAQQLAWSSQDQLSFPYLVRRENVTVTDLSPGSVVDNPWFRYEPHLKS